MQIEPSPDVIGAEIQGVDLTQPLSDAKFSRIEAAFNRYAVICFPPTMPCRRKRSTASRICARFIRWRGAAHAPAPGRKIRPCGVNSLPSFIQSRARIRTRGASASTSARAK